MSPSGINQRMVDFHDAFFQAVDAAIEVAPDFILHSGDIVDSANPPNRSRSIMRQGLKRITKAGIPTIILSGTHDVPKTKRDSHVFVLFNYKDISLITEPDKVVIDVPILPSEPKMPTSSQRVNIFCIPYSNNFAEMKAWFDDTILEKLNEDEYNILMLHCDIYGIEKLEHGYSVLAMPEEVADRYDYVALGHYHTYTLWKGYKNVVFAGSMERKNFDEVGERRYIHQVVMGTKDGEPVLKIKNIPLKTRDMTELVVDLSQVADQDTAYENIKKCIASDMIAREKGAVVQVVMRANYDLYKSLNINYIKAMMPDALYVNPKREPLEEVKEENKVKLDATANIIEEWKKLINSLDESKEDKKWLWQEGKTKLEEVFNK